MFVKNEIPNPEQTNWVPNILNGNLFCNRFHTQSMFSCRHEMFDKVLCLVEQEFLLCDSCMCRENEKFPADWNNVSDDDNKLDLIAS